MIATSSLFIEQCHSEWSHKKKKSWHGPGHRTVDPTEVGMKEEKNCIGNYQDFQHW